MIHLRVIVPVRSSARVWQEQIRLTDQSRDITLFLDHGRNYEVAFYRIPDEGPFEEIISEQRFHVDKHEGTYTVTLTGVKYSPKAPGEEESVVDEEWDDL